MVVEKQHVDVQVAPQQVQEVIPPDGQTVSISSNHPDGEIGIGYLDACRHGGSTPMNGVKPIGVDVIRETTRTTNSTHHDEILPRNTQFREKLLDRAQYGVVSTPRAPTHVIGRSIILLGFFLGRFGGGDRHGLIGVLPKDFQNLFPYLGHGKRLTLHLVETDGVNHVLGTQKRTQMPGEVEFGNKDFLEILEDTLEI